MSPKQFLSLLQNEIGMFPEFCWRSPVGGVPLFIKERNGQNENLLFNPAVINQLEEILQMSFLPEKNKDPNLCLAQSEEVRFDFRTSFSEIHLLDYLLGILQEEPEVEKAGRSIPYPKNSEEFEIQMNKSKRKKEPRGEDF